VRSAFLLSEHVSNAELFDEVRAAVPEGRDWPAPGSTTRMVHVQDAAGRFFTLFEIAADGGCFRADILKPPERIEPGVVVPSLEGRVPELL
jgi:hypothetical protein